MAPLGTRVARRVLGLFLLCALLPVAVTILGSYARVQSALVDQRVAQLGQAAEAFGTALLERFYLADQLARSVAASGAASHAIDERLARYFSSIVVLRPGAAPRVLLGDVSNLPAGTGVEPGAEPHFAAGESVILAPVAAGGGRGVWLLRAIAPEEPRRGLLAVELNPGYLWGDTDELPYLTSVCVLDRSGEPLALQRATAGDGARARARAARACACRTFLVGERRRAQLQRVPGAFPASEVPGGELDGGRVTAGGYVLAPVAALSSSWCCRWWRWGCWWRRSCGLVQVRAARWDR